MTDAGHVLVDWKAVLVSDPDNPDLAADCAEAYYERWVTYAADAQAIMQDVGKPLWRVLQANYRTHPRLVAACGKFFCRFLTSHFDAVAAMAPVFINAMFAHEANREVVFACMLLVASTESGCGDDAKRVVPLVLRTLRDEGGSSLMVGVCAMYLGNLAGEGHFAVQFVEAGLVPAFADALSTFAKHPLVAVGIINFFGRLESHGDMAAVNAIMPLTVPAVVTVLKVNSQGGMTEDEKATANNIVKTALKFCKCLVTHRRELHALFFCDVLQVFEPVVKVHPNTASCCAAILGRLVYDDGEKVRAAALALFCLKDVLEAHLDNVKLAQRVAICGSNIALVAPLFALVTMRVLGKTLAASLRMHASNPGLVACALTCFGYWAKAAENVPSLLAHGVLEDIRAALEGHVLSLTNMLEDELLRSKILVASARLLVILATTEGISAEMHADTLGEIRGLLRQSLEHLDSTNVGADFVEECRDVLARTGGL